MPLTSTHACTYAHTQNTPQRVAAVCVRVERVKLLETETQQLSECYMPETGALSCINDWHITVIYLQQTSKRLMVVTCNKANQCAILKQSAILSHYAHIVNMIDQHQD